MDEKSKPVLTIISRQRLVGSVNGSSAYLIRLLKFAKKCGYEIHLIIPSASVFGRTPFVRMLPELQELGAISMRGSIALGNWRITTSISVWIGAIIGTGIKILNRTFGLKLPDNKRPYSIGVPWTPADRMFVKKNLKSGTTRLLLDYAFQTAILSDLTQYSFRSAIVMHDLFHNRAGQFEPSSGADPVSQLTESAEIELLSKADAVLAIQSVEADFVRRHCRATEVILTPMSTDTVEAPQPGVDDTILFIGSSAKPNVDGLRWFIAEVWPKVLVLNSSTILKVAGSVADAFSSGEYERIEFMGLVEDLDDLYANSGIVISPLRQGSGLKIKLIEALGQGKMMVVTTTTLQGVQEVCEHAVVVTDNPDEFAEMINKYSSDLVGRKAFGQKALDLAQSYFSDETALMDFKSWLQRD